MGFKSPIEWTDSTWNPIRGCSMAKGSEAAGCLKCYAARLSARNLPEMRSPTTGESFARILDSGPRWTGKVELIEKALLLPLHWRKPRRIFVNSLSDLFHDGLTDGEILRVFDVMARCPQHTFQILTKRPGRMYDWMQRWLDTKEANYEPKLAIGPDAVRKAHTCGRALMFASMLESMGKPPAGCAYPTYDWLNGMCRWPNRFCNVWLGVSIENQATADARIPILLRTPAAKRFISYEPALGPVDLRPWLNDLRIPSCMSGDGPYQGPNRLDWVIIGGESGPGARLFDLRWARDTVRACREAGVAVFVKQLGRNPCETDGASEPDYEYLLNDSKGGDWDEWPSEVRVRELPA